MAADLVLATDPQIGERSADPAGFVMAACERARAWLREALEHGQIEQIAELKSQAEAVRVYTAQKQLGKDAQLAAAEIVRRAERGIGVAIRRGQAAGEISRRAGHGGNQHRRAETVAGGFCTAKPSDYASPAELTGKRRRDLPPDRRCLRRRFRGRAGGGEGRGRPVARQCGLQDSRAP